MIKYLNELKIIQLKKLYITNQETALSLLTISRNVAGLATTYQPIEEAYGIVCNSNEKKKKWKKKTQKNVLVIH